MAMDMTIPVPEVTDNQHQLTIVHAGTTYRGDAALASDTSGPHLTLTLASATGYLRLQVPPELDDLLAIQEVLAVAVERVLPMTRENPTDPDWATGTDWTEEQRQQLARLWRHYSDQSDQRGFEWIARIMGRRPTAVKQQLGRQKELRSRPEAGVGTTASREEEPLPSGPVDGVPGSPPVTPAGGHSADGPVMPPGESAARPSMGESAIPPADDKPFDEEPKPSSGGTGVPPHQDFGMLPDPPGSSGRRWPFRR